MEKIFLVYITVGNKTEALSIGNELVTQRIAACVNIIDQMNSIYRWEGELHYDKEVVMIAKTTESRLSELVEMVKANHSYECPCIVSMPVTGGNPAFLEWVINEVNN
jgi:periplasmic divalent cation tolerance protein